MESTIRLFKALPIETKRRKANKELLKQTIAKGFIFTPEVVYNYPNIAHLTELVDKAYGRDPGQLNQTFHKSWAKVRDASMEQLVLEQVIHYFTTYGFEALGIYDKDSVYIPNEELDAPVLEDGIRLVVIKGYTKEELTTKLMELLTSGVALAEETIADVLDVATFVELDEDRIDEVKNKEVKSALYDYFGIVPANPVEFLRYIVYKATNKTLLIKNQTLINEIKGRDNLDIARYFDIYGKDIGLQHLAKIFYRYKPIFLAFRTNNKTRKTINKIRRLAKINHLPMKEDVLNAVTAKITQGEKVVTNDFEKALIDANIFRKIRLAYALKFRTTDADSILYRVRNGKSFAKEFSSANPDKASEILSRVMAAIVSDIKPIVNGKKIFIPEGVKYSLPATEKQFTGNLPTGTYVEIAEDMVAGIHWENQGHSRIDLDLSIQNADGKIGWDAGYRNDQRNVLFSGDITDAPKPKGASELFYFGQQARGVWMMFVNYYNYMSEVPVPFKILVAHQKPARPTTHYTVDANKIVAQSNSIMDVKQKNLGIIVADEQSCKFYFAESDLGRGITARGQDYAEQARKFLLNFYTDSIVLNDVLVSAGAELVTDVAEADIDLSPETIDKTAILNLLTGKEGQTDGAKKGVKTKTDKKIRSIRS